MVNNIMTKMEQQLIKNQNKDNEESNNFKVYETVKATVQGSAVVVFGISDCCMTHVVKQLLYGLGVGPTIVHVDDDDDGDSAAHVLAVIYSLSGGGGGGTMTLTLPAVFIGGEFLGGVDSLMASHIKGSLVPLLKKAGALWL